MGAVKVDFMQQFIHNCMIRTLLSRKCLYGEYGNWSFSTFLKFLHRRARKCRRKLIYMMPRCRDSIKMLTRIHGHVRLVPMASVSVHDNRLVGIDSRWIAHILSAKVIWSKHYPVAYNSGHGDEEHLRVCEFDKTGQSCFVSESDILCIRLQCNTHSPIFGEHIGRLRMCVFRISPVLC